MSIKYVNKSTFASEVGRSPAAITKALDKGIFSHCLSPDGKSIDLEKGMAAYVHYASASKNKILNTHEPVKPKLKTTNNKELDTKIEEAIKDTRNIEALEKLLDDEDIPPLMVVQITKIFWESVKAKANAELLTGNIIYMDDAKDMVDEVIVPLSEYLNNQAHSFKSYFPDIPNECIDWIIEENDRQKIALQTSMDNH